MDLTVYTIAGFVVVLVGVCTLALMQNVKDADECIEEMLNRKNEK